MGECKPVGTPMEQNVIWHSELDENAGEHLLDEKEISRFKSITQKMAWLKMMTRPDLEHVTNILQMSQSTPTSRHWAIMKRALRYLKGTLAHKITYRPRRKGEPRIPELITFVDAAFHSEPKGKSRTGGVIMMAGGAIDWISKRQKTVALSSTDAEIMAAATMGRNIFFLRNVMEELGLAQNIVPMFEDNQSCMKVLGKDVVQQGTRHLSTSYWFTRDMVKREQIGIFFLQTKKMLADAFTKQLPKHKHKEFYAIIMGQEQYDEEVMNHLNKIRGGKS